MHEKSVTDFYTLQYFGAPGKSPAPKFTNLDPDVQQCHLYQPAKFRPILVTRQQDICMPTNFVDFVDGVSDRKQSTMSSRTMRRQ